MAPNYREDIVQNHIDSLHSEGMDSTDYSILLIKRNQLFTLFSVVL